MQLYENSNSQAGQESFVINALNGKRNGYFLEVGAFHGIEDSNTFILEKEFGWNGIAFEKVPKFARRFNRVRNNKCLTLDATTTDFKTLFEELSVPARVDYLQLDIEPGPNTLSAMVQIPFDNYRFSVITFEHDLYREPENRYVKKWSSEFLSEHGYVRVVSNVKTRGLPFEDWWVDPAIVSNAFIEENSKADVNWEDCFRNWSAL
jgi:hypothetical protein